MERRRSRPPLPLPDIHLLPPLEEWHEVSKDCYCCPRIEVDLKTGRQVISHTSREEAN